MNQQFSVWLLTLGWWWIWFGTDWTPRGAAISGFVLGIWTSALFVWGSGGEQAW